MKRQGSGIREQGSAREHGLAEKPRILIADDEQSMREWMRLLFQRDGFEVLTEEAKILTTVRERLKSHPVAAPAKGPVVPANKCWVEVPYRTSAYELLYHGSACYVLLPEDLIPPVQHLILPAAEKK